MLFFLNFLDGSSYSKHFRTTDLGDPMAKKSSSIPFFTSTCLATNSKVTSKNVKQSRSAEKKVCGDGLILQWWTWLFYGERKAYSYPWIAAKWVNELRGIYQFILVGFCINTLECFIYIFSIYVWILHIKPCSILVSFNFA